MVKTTFAPEYTLNLEVKYYCPDIVTEKKRSGELWLWA